MAPNLVVKSESWLDLSAFERQVNKSELQAIGNGKITRHSVSQQSLYFENNYNYKKNNSNNQHLLIRLRQQSFLNRSNASLTSHLSQSVDLAPSLGSISSIAASDMQGVSSKFQPQLERESLKLSQLKRRLNTKTNSRCHLEVSSPLTRSWSSLSERLSGRFSDLRHSCKLFLYHYNRGKRRHPNLKEDSVSHSQTKLSIGDRDERFEVNSSRQANERMNTNLDLNSKLNTNPSYRQRIDSLSEVNKCQLTSEWLTRHCGESRAKSQEPNVELVFEHQLERPKSLQINSQQTKVNLNFQEAPNERQESRELAHINSRDIKYLAKNCMKKFSAPSSSSSSTLVSSSSVRPKSGKMREPNEAIELNRNIQTSDYWSTVASNEFHKHHQRLHQQPINGLTMNTAQNEWPINLLADNQDQDYYLDVASANERRQIETNRMMMLNESQLAAEMLINSPTQNHQDYDDYDDYAVPADESCRLERSQVELVQLIGEGQKGYVFLGKLQSRDGSHISDVAIKTLKYETGQLIEKLMREAAMMRQLEHPHIIRFIGVCPETPALIAMELAQFGEIKSYFKVNGLAVSVAQLVLFTFQISTALSYLESKQYVHRDVAARNVLVCNHYCVKLADFGLSRNLQSQQASAFRDQLDHEDHYVAAPRVKLPVRWLAPESLVFRRFTSASDVWMFAVCSWELFHLCHLRPWANIRNNQVLAAIESGQRLARPPSCPPRLYELMLRCWNYAPVQRPKFRDIKQCIWSIYLNERTKQQLEIETQRQQELNERQQARLMMPIVDQRPKPERLVLSNSNQLQVPNVERANQQNHQTQVKSRQDTKKVPVCVQSGASGYSSATPTAELSNNSSRSSSMGSLARQQQAIAARLLNQRAQVPISQQPVGPQGSSRATERLAPHESIRIKQIPELARAADVNARRFHKSPTHNAVLQKQRSQGSIGMSSVEPLETRRYPNRQSLALDDDWIRNRQTRAQSDTRFGFNDDDLSADGDEENSSDEAELILSNKMRATQQATCTPASIRINQPTDSRKIPTTRDNRWRPASWRQEQVSHRESPTRSERVTRAKSPLEFGHNLIKSLGITPMKAKLREGRQCSAEPSTKNNNRLHLKQPNQLVRLDESQATREQVDDQQRQLAIHQRLLGRIRPASMAATKQTTNRRSANLTLQEAEQLDNNQTRNVESVDQSLQLLESLMSEGSSFCNSPKGDFEIPNRRLNHR